MHAGGTLSPSPVTPCTSPPPSNRAPMQLTALVSARQDAGERGDRPLVGAPASAEQARAEFRVHAGHLPREGVRGLAVELRPPVEQRPGTEPSASNSGASCRVRRNGACLARSPISAPLQRQHHPELRLAGLHSWSGLLLSWVRSAWSPSPPARPRAAESSRPGVTRPTDIALA